METEKSEETDNVKVGESSQSSSLLNEVATDVKEENALSKITTAEEYLEENKIPLLDYEKQIFLDIIHSDGLLICAKGISYEPALINLLKVYSDAANLILVINFSDWEEKFYKSQLDKKYVHEVANTATERERVYLEGGIQFISTRILVVDLLKKRIPVELITGIVVLRAHTIVESCQEAFAVCLYRQKNKTGFIKAFSNSPEAFTVGYSHVERTMRNLFVRELFIWPRFHATIQASLKPYVSQTIELHVPMTPKMTQIQTNLLDIMNYLVKEIKRINRSVDLQEITVENCVTKKFHKILQAQLDCIWHQLNSQTKLIVSDLKVLRNLMISTIYRDAVSTYSLSLRYRKTEYALSNSGWTLLDAAENLFKALKGRVFNEKKEFDPEHCPKWRVLSEILTVEIPNDVKKSNLSSKEPVKVLILCQDSRTCYQLNQYLTQGAEHFLLNMARKNDISLENLSEPYKKSTTTENTSGQENTNEIKSKASQPVEKSKPIKLWLGGASDKESELLMETETKEDDELTQLLKKDDNIENELFRESYILTMTQKDSPTVVEQEDNTEEFSQNDGSIFEPFPEMENLNVSSVILNQSQPLICIQSFKTELEGSMGLERTLNDFRPHYIIMYHSNVTAVRQLEVYEARLRRKAKDRLKIFFLIHARTVEEQSYLTSLRREKQAFELLIDTKSKMVVPEYQDGKTDEVFFLMKPSKTFKEDEVNTREAGGQNTDKRVPSKIIVDMREFRSDLPCLIHRRGIEIMPVTISIGDYILTPDICVERKSISDLIGSLNSGRLYNQCIQMQRFYSKPILLIEFDQSKPFHLQGKYMLSADTASSNADIVQKLQLLTLHFPKLRLIWSPSPYATAQLFEELKQGKPEPDANTAAHTGSDESDMAEIDKFNPNIYDFMIRLPGINSKNIAMIMRKGGNLKELLKKSEKELGEILDSEANGKLLWNILHVEHKPQKATESVAKTFMSKYRKFKSGSSTLAGSSSSSSGFKSRGKFGK